MNMNITDQNQLLDYLSSLPDEDWQHILQILRIRRKPTTLTTTPTIPITAARHSSDTVLIWTDGGCEPNPGDGGWAAVIIQNGTLLWKLSGSQRDTTNNRMETKAVLEALKVVAKHDELKSCPIVVHGDNQYVINGASTWMEGWKTKGWMRKKQPVKNDDLWKELYETVHVGLAGTSIEWTWVKGHSGNKWNELCDQLCNREIADLRRGRH